MYSKKRRESRADTGYFFSLRRFQKWKQKTKKTKNFKEFSKDFFLQVGEEKKNNLGWKQFEHTASTILVVQMVTKN